MTPEKFYSDLSKNVALKTFLPKTAWPISKEFSTSGPRVTLYQDF